MTNIEVESIKPNKKKSRLMSRQDICPIKRFFMDSLKTWCHGPTSRMERTKRKEEIADIINKDPQTIKNMYLYGQGSLDQWFKVMDHISPLKQENLIQMYLTYPYFEDQYGDVSKAEISIMNNIKKLSEGELKLISKLIETGVKLNKALNK